MSSGSTLDSVSLVTCLSSSKQRGRVFTWWEPTSWLSHAPMGGVSQTLSPCLPLSPLCPILAEPTSPPRLDRLFFPLPIKVSLGMSLVVQGLRMDHEVQVHRSIPGQGTKIVHAAEQLSQHTTTRVHAPERSL